MRKLFFILSVFAFVACNDDEPEPSTPDWENLLKEYQEYIASFNVDSTGLILTHVGNIQWDTTAIVFSGIRDGKLWFAEYSKITRNKIFEWHDSEFVPQIREKTLADGTKKSIPIKHIVLDGPVTHIDNNYIFIVYSGNDFIHSTPYTTDFYDLYFLREGKVTKYQGAEICTEIQGWHPGTILTKGFPWCCFSYSGEKLYSFHEGVYRGIPINIEECINASLSGLKRVNLKTGEIKWQTGQLYKDLSNESQVFIYKDSAIDTVWTFKVLLMEGLKLKATRTFTVDIETGKINYL